MFPAAPPTTARAKIVSTFIPKSPAAFAKKFPNPPTIGVQNGSSKFLTLLAKKFIIEGIPTGLLTEVTIS